MNPLSVTLQSPAKLNLYLHVGECREDGYHEITTVFLPLFDLCDFVTITHQEGTPFSVTAGEEVTLQEEDNICYTAASLFSQESGSSLDGLRVSIEKHIPVAAGLGGGSSNAATVLLGLNQMYGHPLTRGRLFEIAKVLGADVPFFLDPAPVIARGIGNQFEPIPCNAELGLIVINPGFPVSSGWAYHNLHSVRHLQPPEIAGVTKAMEEGDIDALARHTFNDLEYPVCYKFPILEVLIEFLYEAGCCGAHVSGSGPTVFGMCRKDDAQYIREEVDREFHDMVYLCMTAYT